MGRKVVQIDTGSPNVYRLVHGIKMVNGRPYLDKAEETRYVYNDPDMLWYYNDITEAIELRINNEEV